MYKIWCEVTKLKLFFPIICLIIMIGDYFISGVGYDFYIFLILFVLCLIILIKSVIKYLSLKKNGCVIDNVPYEIICRNNERIMVVDYTNNLGSHLKLYKYKEQGTAGKVLSSIPEKGVTSIIINPNNEKQYYVFYPNAN